MPEQRRKLENLPHGKTAEAFNKAAKINPTDDFNRAAGQGWQGRSGGSNFAPTPKLGGPKPPASGQEVTNEANAARLQGQIDKTKQQQQTNAVKLRKAVVSLEHIEKAKKLQEKIRAANKDKDRGR